jgi:hypothetical protein
MTFENHKYQLPFSTINCSIPTLVASISDVALPIIKKAPFSLLFYLPEMPIPKK